MLHNAGGSARRWEAVRRGGSKPSLLCQCCTNDCCRANGSRCGGKSERGSRIAVFEIRVLHDGLLDMGVPTVRAIVITAMPAATIPNSPGVSSRASASSVTRFAMNAAAVPTDDRPMHRATWR